MDSWTVIDFSFAFYGEVTDSRNVAWRVLCREGCDNDRREKTVVVEVADYDCRGADPFPIRDAREVMEAVKESEGDDE